MQSNWTVYVTRNIKHRMQLSQRLLDLSCLDAKDVSEVNNRGGSEENSDGA
jgi:hypothetical protein